MSANKEAIDALTAEHNNLLHLVKVAKDEKKGIELAIADLSKKLEVGTKELEAKLHEESLKLEISLSGARLDKEDLDKELSELSAKLNKIEKGLVTKTADTVLLDKEIEIKKGIAQKAIDLLNSMEAKKLELEKALEVLTDKISKLETKQAEAKQANLDLKGERATILASLEAEKQELEHLEKASEAANKRILELLASEKDSKKTLEDNAVKNKELLARHESLLTSIAKLEEDLAKFEAERDEKFGNLKMREDVIAEAERVVQQKSAQLKREETRIRALQLTEGK